jgi:hypothetical protein
MYFVSSILSHFYELGIFLLIFFSCFETYGLWQTVVTLLCYGEPELVPPI